MDLNTASQEQLDQYRAQVAGIIKIDPLMLDYIWMFDPETGLKNRVLYAKRGAAEILRQSHTISITSVVPTIDKGWIMFTATGCNPAGRQEIAVGAAYLEGLRADKLAHGVMTAQTRAVRRLTLQFIGGGILDETEVQAQSDLSVAPAASQATLVGSPMVIPPVPTAPLPSAPGKDISPAPATPVSPNPPVSTVVEIPAPVETEAKVKRTRKPKNTVNIESPAAPPATPPPSAPPVSALAPTAPAPVPSAPAVEAAQPAPVQVQVVPTPPPSNAAALAPEKAKEFRDRLRVYSSDVLVKGGMLPSEKVGGVTMKLRAFAEKHAGGQQASFSLTQWEDLFDFLDSYLAENGPAGLVKYIDSFIAVPS
jgi:hypothetical protein